MNPVSSSALTAAPASSARLGVIWAYLQSEGSSPPLVQSQLM